MRKIVFLILILGSCTSKKIEEDFIFLAGKVLTVDSLLIDEDSLVLGITLNEKIYNDSLLVMGDGTFAGVHLISLNTGKRIQTFGNSPTLEYPLPEKSYANSFISGDTLYLLNHLTHQIFSFSLTGDYLFTIDLQLGQNLNVLDRDNVFELKNNKWYVSSKAEGPLSEVYEKSQLISVFNFDGEFLFSFGKYPEEYTQGQLVLSHNENFVFKDQIIYSVNVAGSPVLKKYDLAGNLISTFALSSEYFNSEIGYHNGDPFTAPLTDQINNLAINPTLEADILYLTYSTFDTRDFETGLSTYRLMLMQVDLESKTIREVELFNSDYLSNTSELIPMVKNNILSILVRDQNQSLYLKRLSFLHED